MEELVPDVLLSVKADNLCQSGLGSVLTNEVLNCALQVAMQWPMFMSATMVAHWHYWAKK